MDEEQPQPDPFKRALLTGLQMLAMALCVLIIGNMIAESQQPPVGQCPIKAEQ